MGLLAASLGLALAVARQERYKRPVSEQNPSNAAQPDKPAGYLVLARKYRPRRFEDLVGQEAMVRTIANSFAMGRVPHAYILTGVRGIGKTTTARLLARALNYKTAEADAPSVQLEPLGEHCQAIMESRHPDVFEMDAASRTGIGDIRELLEGVRYAPIAARYKVYIIDEVHMLSTAAFNGLLKTLEEPPPHVKFVFATTEIRKVPVTVLSRCQRFDLKRIATDRLTAHLADICAREGVTVEPEGLALIARAAEGSVRDALSLLDQALVQQEGAEVGAAIVRDMLGLADRGRVLDLFLAVTAGDAKAALTELRAQHESGADPATLLRDLLEITHEAAMAQTLGERARIVGGADWERRIRQAADMLTTGQLSRIWQLLLKALEEAGRAPDPLAAVEMALVRLAAAMGLPPPEEAARLLREHAGNGGAGRAQGPAPAGDAGPRLLTLEELVALLSAKRPDIELEIAVERFVRVAELRPGFLHCKLEPGAPENLAYQFARALEEASGRRWEVRDDAPDGAETIAARLAREQAEQLEALKRHPFVAQALKAFPEAEIAAVHPAEDVDTQARGAEIVPLPNRSARTANGEHR